MNKMRNKIIASFLLTILFLIPTNIYAAEGPWLKITTSSTTITVGSTVTIRVSQNDLAGKFSVTSSNSSVLSGGVGSDKFTVSGESKSYKFTAKSVGTAKITVNAIDLASFSTEQKYSSSKSITINVVKPREKSTNNNLKSLSVEGYSLSPEFNKDTLEYTVELEASVEKIMVNAEKADSYASLSGGGEITVSEGDNRIEIKVTSETGKEKVYVINAVVKDSNPITTTVNDKKLTVVKKASSLTKPDLFEETKIKINEMEVPAFYNEATKTTLVGLRDEKGKIELYIYDQDKNSYQKYLTLIGTEFHLIQKEAKGIPEGYQKVTKKIDDIEYTAYQKDKSDFLLLYGTILENGSEGWYSYDTKEKTLQRYNKDIVESITKEYQDIQDTDHKVIIGLAVLSSVLALTTMILALRKPRTKKVSNKEKKEELSEDKKSKVKKGNQKKNNGKEKEENSSNE